MALTTVSANMTTAEFVSAVNGNMTFLAMKGRFASIDATMPDWRIASCLKINGLGDYSNRYLGGEAFMIALNAAFIYLQNNKTITIVGAVDAKSIGAIGNGIAEDVEAINAALVNSDVLVQDGTFLIESSLIIPSNRTLHIYNAQVKSKNATYDNIFRNSDINNGNVNCKIIGHGCAELYANGGNNDDSYATYGVNVPTDPPIRYTQCYRYINGFFCQVDGFEISGLILYDPVHWYYYLQSCKNGSFHDCYSLRIRHSQNQAILTAAWDCHEIDVYNITGNNDDDTFAWASHKGYCGLAYIGYTDYNVGDCHDIRVWNVEIDASDGYSAFGSMCTIMVGDGNKVYNIAYRNVRAKKAGALLYSSFSNYVTNPGAKTDCYNLTMENCKIDQINTKTGAFYFGTSMMNCSFTRIQFPIDKMKIVYTDGDQTDNVKINGIQI